MSGYIGTQPVPQATQTRDSFTCTAGQTSFATGGYTPTFLDVYLNGIFLANGADYTAANGSDVILTAGAAAGDILEVVAYTTFEVANVTSAHDFTVTGSFTSQSIDATGTVTATAFDGDGSALTGIAALSTWTSGDNTWAAGGTYTLSHSLGVVPKAVQVELVCIVANNGYSVGDVHVLNSGERYANWGVAVINIASTSIKWGVYSAGILFRNESSTSSSSRSTSQWRVRFSLIG